MIDTSAQSVFPDNFIQCLKTVIPALDTDGDLVVIDRPLRPTDPNYCVGIYASLWEPDENSYEIGHNAPHEPTLSRYQIVIQTMIKDGDTQRALAISSILTKRIRSMLYRNDPLRVALASLWVSEGTFKESLRRWGIRLQRYLSNDIEGKFVTISVMELWIETETT